jgi:hypothetical protein
MATSLEFYLTLHLRLQVRHWAIIDIDVNRIAAILLSRDPEGANVTPVSNEAIQALLDKQAIAEILMRYCRSMDRQDRELAESVYWPDATDDHILYCGDVPGFVAHAFRFMADVRTVHFVGNILIDFQSVFSAYSETYYIAYHDMPSENGRQDMTLWGRYLDHVEKRGNEWRIKARTLTLDAFTVAPGTAVWDKGMFAGIRTRGGAKPNDPLYRLHPQS